MNKAKLFLSAALCWLFFYSAHAQINQCEIEYQVDVVSAEGAPPMAQEMMKDMVMTIAFKDQFSRIDMDMSLGLLTTITDAEQKKTVVLTSMMGQNVAQIIEGQDFEELQASQGSQDDVKIRETGKSKKIAGYQCFQAFVSTPGSEIETEIWYSKEIIPKAEVNQYSYEGLKGFPLEMIVNQQGVNLRMTASRVSKEPKPEGYFDPVVPEGYNIQRN